MTNSSAQRARVSSTTVTTTQKLRFTLMLGKRVGPIAGRFGIKESTGGFGVDLFLLDDRLTLSVDVFDTLANQYPRVKPALAGVDLEAQPLPGRRAPTTSSTPTARVAGAGGGIDWFLGGQLVFNDEDLKSLLLFGGGAASGAAK